MLQFTAKQNVIRSPERMQHEFTIAIRHPKLTPGQTGLSSRQQQYSDRKEMDLTMLQRTHIKKARCPGKKISKEGKGVRLLTMMLIRGHY